MNEAASPAAAVAICALVTILIRFAPFLLFRGKKETPAFVVYLGRVLPYAVMAMLVVFCLKEIRPDVRPHGLPELIAGAVTVGLHAWKGNTLLSIVSGTVCYMILIQQVFIGA